MYITDYTEMSVEQLLAGINNILLMWFYAWLMFNMLRHIKNNLRGVTHKWKNLRH